LEVLSYETPYHRGTETGSAAFNRSSQAPTFFTDPFAAEYQGKPANPRWIPLYSRKYFAPGTRFLAIGPNGQRASVPNPDYNPAVLFNINTPNNPFRPGYLYLSGMPGFPALPRREKDTQGDFPKVGNETSFAFREGEAATERPVYVQWLPIYQDPTRPGGPKNPMVARYAYWVDVENTKIHANSATRVWRESPAFAWVGDADAIHLGSGSYFEQGAQNPTTKFRQSIEGNLPAKENKTLSGADGPGHATAVGATLRSLWLDWQGSQPPLAADTSTIDWDFFLAHRPFIANGIGHQLDFSSLIRTRAASVASGHVPALGTPQELFSLLDPALESRGASFARQVAGTFQSGIITAVTVYGYEEERDPLGRAKIDLVKFLRQYRSAAGSGGNPNLFRGSELWKRLTDPAYHKAYDPGLVANNGVARSFAQSLNRFAGDGNPNNDQNGEFAVLQMLVNMVEYTLPPSTAPLVSEATGLVGMRSMPYVAEVSTRARSALWLLPAADRENLNTLLARDAQGNFTYTYEGKPLEYYVTHVLLDVALAFMNPDPFATEPFDGTVTLEYSWHNPPAGAQLKHGPQTMPLKGIYAISPEAGEDPKSVSVHGNAVVFPLGILPAAVLSDKNHSTLLRIKGWKIHKNGQLWHQVPIRHPGATDVREWWEMAQPTAAATGAFDNHIKDPTISNYPAVGWFVIPKAELDNNNKPLRTRLQMMHWDEGFPSNISVEQLTRMRNFIGSLRWRAVFETVQCLDPAMGHRTGHPGIRSEISPGKFGHVFGPTGHPWRHRGSSGESQKKEWPDFENFSQNFKAKKLLLAGQATPGSNSLTLSVKKGEGIRTVTGSLQVPVRTTNLQAGSELNGQIGNEGPGGLLEHFRALNLDTFPLSKGEFKLKDDGKFLEDLGKQKYGDNKSKAGTDADCETLLVAQLPQYKALKTDEMRKNVKSLLCGAPRGEMMTSIGEIGFVHSGLPNFPILLTESHGWNEYQLNCPKNGPPQRMLLDLFTPGAFTDPISGRPIARSAWENGTAPSHTPMTPRRGTWNVNTAIAHEGYLTIREGKSNTNEEMKKEYDPVSHRAWAIWHPSAGGWRRNSFGNEHHQPNKEFNKKIPGEPLDRLASPFPAFPRGWNAWVAMVGGDFSPTRAVGGGAWSYLSPGYNTFAPGQFTWCAGRGIAKSAPFYRTAFAELGNDNSLHSQLLTFGSDGRKELELDESTGKPKKVNENDGFLRGRFAADNWIDFQKPAGMPNIHPPRSHSTRFSLFPLRHHISDLAIDYNYGAELRRFKTALNPSHTAFPPVVNSDGKLSENNHFPGGHHASGLFLNAPLVLLANQASTSANAFTLHIVAQTVKDTGAARPGIANSGVGHCDPDDQVLSETWCQVVLEKIPPTTENDTQTRFIIRRLETR
jgi:hypothetical protein